MMATLMDEGDFQDKIEITDLDHSFFSESESLF